MANRAAPGSIFVGRDREIASLTAALEDTLAGRPRLVLLAGDAGMGKTHTAEALGALALQRGAHVFWGRCFEDAGAPPFWPWVQILRAVRAQTAPDSFAQITGGHVAEIAALLPETSAPRPPEDGGAVPLDSAQVRFRFFEQIVSLIEHSAGRNPVVLILDDLHEADPSSLRLLEFAARNLGAPVLILACHRIVGTNHPMTATLLEVLRVPGVQQLTLGGLTLSEVAEFIQRSTETQPSVELAKAIHQRTEGNPLFVKEYLQLLLSRHEGRAVADAKLVHALGVPDTLRALVRRRMEPLSAACRPVLTRAAMIGRTFSRALLISATADLESPLGDRAARAIGEGIAAGLITGDLEPETYRFTHAILRESLYAEIDAAERMRLHRLIGEATEARADHEEHLAELAHHFCAAGGDERVTKGFAYARRAADRAMAVLAYEEAVRLYGLALSAIETLRPTADAERCRVLIALGRARNSVGDLEGSKEMLLQAAAIAQRLGLHQQLADAALQYGPRLVWGEGPVLDAVRLELIESALEAWRGTGSNTEAALLASLGLTLKFSPEVERSQDASRKGLELARLHSDPVTLLSVLNAWHTVHFRPSTCDERLRVSTEMVELAERMGDAEMAFQAHTWRFDDCFESADRAGIDRALAARERLAQDLRQSHCWWVNKVVRASISTLEGRFADAEREVERALELGRGVSFGAEVVREIQLAVLSMTHGIRADLRTAATTLSAFAAALPVLPTLGALVAFSAAELGDNELARQYFAPKIGACIELPDDQNWLLGMACLARTSASLGEVGAAQELYRRLFPYASRLPMTPGANITIGPIALYLGKLAGVLGRPADAVTHFETAAGICVNMRSRPWLARTQFEHARVLLARDEGDDRESARHLLATALATAGALGMPMLEEWAAELAAGIPSSAGRTRAAADSGNAGRDHQPTNSFRREGDYWSIAYQGAVVRLKDSKGLQYLVQLVAHPAVEFLALDLVARCRNGAAPTDGSATVREGSLAALDPTAKAAYRGRVAELRENLEEAEDRNDCGTAERARAEIQFIEDELATAIGLGGRDRAIGSSAERARSTVTKGIKSAIAKIAAAHPTLGRHFDRTVRTGVFCAYEPDDDGPRWQL